MSDTAITVTDVSKVFRLPHEKQTSIKGKMVGLLNGGKGGYETQRALDDISFTVKKGEFFGIVGKNGSGKSTLLKILAGIYTPTAGSVTVDGGLTPFIELGVGFNPELTGRENVFLNGALLGFSRSEMAMMYDDIVAFAEIERFMDQKLKNYSSGMQVRLAFSIAIQAKSDILILDEVLAVGDEAFQKKCISVFETYKAKKQTIILVTHDMATVEKYCDRAILIDDGKLLDIGTPQKVAHQYSAMNLNRYKASRPKRTNGEIGQLGVYCETTDMRGIATNTFDYGQDAIVRLHWDAEKNQIRNVGIALLKKSGEYVFGTNTFIDKHAIENNSVEYTLNLNLQPGEYSLTIGLFGDDEADALEYIDDEGPTITIESREEIAWGGITNLKHGWK